MLHKARTNQKFGQAKRNIFVQQIKSGEGELEKSTNAREIR